MRRSAGSGTYNVRVYTAVRDPAGALPVRIAFWVDGKRAGREPRPVQRAGFFQDKQDFWGKFREFTVRLGARRTLARRHDPRLFDGLPARYGGPRPSSARAGKPASSCRRPTRTQRSRAARKEFEDQHGRRPSNDARISYFEIAGPVRPESGPPPEREARLYTCGHLDGHTRPHAPGSSSQSRAPRVPAARRTGGPRRHCVACSRRPGGGDRSMRVRHRGPRGPGFARISSSGSRESVHAWPRRTATAPGSGARDGSELGDPALVFPLGEHARSGAASRWRRAASCARPASSTRGPPDAARPQGACARRRSSAASGCRSARSSRPRPTRSASPPSTITCACRCGGRRSSSSSDHAGGPQHPRLPRCA